MKPLTHASSSLKKRNRYRCSSKGLFCFCYINRQGALADGLHGLNPRITAHRFTPVQKANSVDCATVKAIGTTVEQGQSYKRSNPSCELGAFFVLRHVKAWRGKEEIGSIHPWRTVQQRK
ncbi:hypothetical protein [Caudoviricetes sp.]|nr:hypothetical protein [Caudoviricetes sp.]